MAHLTKELQWYPSRDLSFQNVQKIWIIDVLAQYLISCDGNANGEPDASVEPSSILPPDLETMRSIVRSDDRKALNDVLLELYYSKPAVWTGGGDASDDKFGGDFLVRLNSVRKKKAAALKTRQDLILLQDQYGPPDPADDWWYTTRDPNIVPVQRGHEIVVYGDQDPGTNAYPTAYIAFTNAAAGIQFYRQGREPGTTGIVYTEFLISSNVSSCCPPFSSMFVSPPPHPLPSRVTCASFLLYPTTAARLPVVARDGFRNHRAQS